MKLGNRKQEKWNLDWKRVGRKNGYIVNICYNSHCNTFFFVIQKGENVFNSLRKEMRYASEGECVAACKMYIDELLKGEKHEKC